jgi:hypothetical protein
VGPQQISTIVFTCADTIRLATPLPSAADDLAELKGEDLVRRATRP